MASASGDRLLFVTGWHELRGDFGIPLDLVMPELVEVERERTSEILAAATARAEEAGVEADRVAPHGNPAEEICAVARERRPRMIVIGSHGWGSIEGALFGSVLNRVLHHAPCPVLVVPQPDTTDRPESAPPMRKAPLSRAFG